MSNRLQGGKEALYDDLTHRILTLELEPNADLDEAALSAAYGVSRTPLREVLQRLAGEGYVELRPNRGARVADMSHTSLRAFFLAAPMIYANVLRLAAEMARPAQIEALKNTQLRFARALEGHSVAERTLANNAFHAITGEMCGNRYLLPSFRRLLIDHARIGMTFYHTPNAHPGSGPDTGANAGPNAGAAEKLNEASRQHEAMIAAIEARDGARAAALAIEHWTLSRGQFEQFVLPHGLADLRVATAGTEAS